MTASGSEAEPARGGLSRRARAAGEIAAAAAHRFADLNCLRMAASLSYTSLLAVVPLSAIAFAMLAAFPVFEGVRDQFNEALFSNFLPQAADSMRAYFDQFIRNTAGLSAVGIVGLALTAILLLGTVESSLNTIFRVGRARRIGPRLLVFWALITLGPLLLGASFSISTYFFAATEVLGLDVKTGGLSHAAAFLPFLLMTAFLTLFYVAIPNRPVAISAGLAGALMASVIVAGLRDVFELYVSSFPTYQNIYGALSAIPIFLIYMYLSWAVVLWGAALAATICEWRAAGGRIVPQNATSGTRLTRAVGLLAALRRQSRTGGSLGRRGLLETTGMAGHTLDQLLEVLQKARYVEETSGERWVLARDLEAVSLYDLYRTLGLGFADGSAAVEGESGWKGRLGDRLDQLRRGNAATLDVRLSDLLREDCEEEMGGDRPGRPDLREVR